MDHGRTDSLHTAPPTIGQARHGGSHPASGPETVSTWAATTSRHGAAQPLTAPAAARTVRLRSREVLVGAATAVAALGLVTAIVLSGSADEPAPDGATLAPASAAAAPERCEGDVHSITGRVVTDQRGPAGIPVGFVEVRTATTCRSDGAVGEGSPIPVAR